MNPVWPPPEVDLDELQGRRAGIVTRGLAFCIDFGIVIAGMPLMQWGIGVVIGVLTFSRPTYPDLPDWLLAIMTGTWTFGYFTVCWAVTGRTIGQALMGLRVVGRTRHRVGLIQAGVRTVILLFTLLFAWLWLLLSKQRLALHDRAARTQVVYDRAPKHTELDLKLGAKGATVANPTA